MNIEPLIKTTQVLAVHFGSALSEAESLVNTGASWDSKTLTHLAARINEVQGALNATYHAAKLLLPPGDFENYVTGTTLSRHLIEDGIKRMDELINTQPGYGTN